jgi:alkane 1-monooxygenase
MTSATQTAVWKDDKRYWWPSGAVIMLFPLLAGLVAERFAAPWFHWFPLVFIFGVVPLLDWLKGEDESNPPESAVAELSKDKYYRYAVYAAVPTLYISFFWGVYTLAHGGLVWYAKGGLIAGLGLISGVSVNTAHELGHKAPALERWLAKLALAPSMYGNFFVEHNRGHHIRVSTPEDPASSRFGEHLYEFIPRSCIGAHKSAWELEASRLKSQKFSVWSWRNHNLQAWAMTLVLFGGVTAWLGWGILPYLILQGTLGFCLFETVNYLEHYGLLRQKLASGKYERCEPHHSWNSNHRITNVVLYQLQRHSDHHANATRPYQALRNFEGAPELPNGYAGMVVIAAIPPLWFALMNPRVVAHYQGDMTKANIKPSIRERVLARYAPAAAGQTRPA